MTISLDFTRHAGPIYQALATALEAAIGDGRLPAGERLPPQRDLAYELGVTVGTVGRAYDMLGRRGLVRGEIGRGTYVLDRDRSAGERLKLGEPAAAPVVDLTMNVPAPVALHGELPGLLARAAARLTATDLARYPPVAGARRHRACAAAWLTRLGVPAAAERVMFTAGAQAAISAALLATCRPGDTLLVEALSYTGFLGIARRLGLRLEGVEIDAEGLVPDALEAAARRTGARVLILSPTVQNPTAACLPADRRQAVAAAARAHDLLVIEDEVYGPLARHRPEPLAALLPERTFFITGLSKIVSPALRVGLLLPPAHWLDRTTLAQADLVLATALPSAELFTLACDEGLLERAIAEQRAALATRHASAASRLAGLAFQAQPDGLHLWLPRPDGADTEGIALRLATEGIKVAADGRFRVGRDAAKGLRVSLGGPLDPGVLDRALERIRATLLDCGGASDRVI